MPFRPLTIERLAVWILFILLFAMAVRVPLDTDTWWHLRSGKAILDEGKIPTRDEFSHTLRGEDWIDQSWLAQIALYGSYKLTGGDGDPGDTGTIGLALFTAILATAGMALIYRMCAGNVYSKMFVLVIGAATAAIFWTPRPQMFSFLLSTVVLYLLYLYKYKQIDRLWLIPVMMILWANLHAGFAIGFIYLFGFLGGEVVGNILDKKDEHAVNWKRLQKVGLITLVSIFALSLNPYGPQMILYPFRTAGIQTLNLFIQEWRSPDFKMVQTWPFLILLAAVIVFGSRTRHRLAWSDLALTAGTALLALWASRNIAVFAVIATPVLSRQVDAWLTERKWQLTPSRQPTASQVRLNWILLIVVLFAAIAKIGSTLTTEQVKENQEEFLPVEAAEYLRENNPAGPMFNEYNWGGYFIFAVPDIPVFVDGRTDLYDDSFLKDYFRATLGTKEWRKPLDKYDIRLVVVDKTSALATLLREKPDEWGLVHEDDLAAIFERVVE
ncbi:MAG: hypothetical protein K8L91_31150 [Anaerolineae bacterium]|nr:hypothetical protein [Anaerolineae bacterium]